MYSSFAMNLENSADEGNHCPIHAPARGRVADEMSVMKAAVFAAAPSMVALTGATSSGWSSHQRDEVAAAQALKSSP
ncbi:MAG: hypothetical protein RR729_13970 [Comamonas sp.]